MSKNLGGDHIGAEWEIIALKNQLDSIESAVKSEKKKTIKTKISQFFGKSNEEQPTKKRLAK